MLDFTLYSDAERVDYIKSEISDRTKKPANTELEQMANYILYGKGANGTSSVDRGEIEIETRYKSYKRREVGSLDELMDLPGFDEQHFQPVKRSTYKNPKPTIDKKNPNLVGLVKEIEKFQEIYDKASLGLAVNGKTYTDTELYKLKHFLISLKKEQFVIADACTPKRQTRTDQPFFFDGLGGDLDVDVFPLGLKIGNLERFTNPRLDKTSKLNFANTELYIDFENEDHVYALIEYYDILKKTSSENPFKSTKYLIETLDWYIDRADLNEIRTYIVKCKMEKIPNAQIAEILTKKFGVGYSDNYISTIYKKEICRKIAQSATLHRIEWENRGIEENWKQCNECGEWKLKTKDNFVQRKNSKDGFSHKCKKCEKKKRLEKEAKNAI